MGSHPSQNEKRPDFSDAHVIGLPIGRGYKRGMQKQAAKTKVFTQETLTELQDRMHKYAEQEMNEHPEIFKGEDLKETEKGRNSDWSKEYFVRQKAEKVDAVEKKTRESVIVKLNEHKKEIAEEPRRKLFHNKHRKPELD